MIVVLKLVYPSLLSFPFRANVSYYFAANMVRDERFCHIFSFILNHKALSFSFVFQSWTLLFPTISATCDFGFCVDVNMCISLFILFITTKQDWEHFKITGHWMLFHKLFLAITSPGQTVLCRYQNKTFLKTCSIPAHSLYLLCTQVFHNRGKKITWSW